MTGKQKKTLVVGGLITAAVLLLLIMLQQSIKELLFVMVTVTIEWIVGFCNILGLA